ncbi:hypothetical protein QVD17_11257 [Tagetes erecta]|uniref:Uncharacterized protein n=1 Tax=Tagetes erecta TaxID=13708 RepID=A0AAD8KU44_TARER|nr:hypothetical protein QVD17_11257 [Tagetes erecta]
MHHCSFLVIRDNVLKVVRNSENVLEKIQGVVWGRGLNVCVQKPLKHFLFLVKWSLAFFLEQVINSLLFFVLV